jgi:DNA-binding response OmpR family regulator
MKYSVLIIDDEKELAESTSEYFNMMGISSKYVLTSQEALDFFKDNEAGVILLDINLGDASGFSLCKTLRETIDSPILFISARSSDDDMVVALNIGGDDYLTKPFHIAELSARGKSVFRRKQQHGENFVAFGNVKILPETRQVLVNGQPIELLKKEFDMLHFFMTRPERAVSKGTLAESVWGDYIDQADNYDFIYAQMKNLRKRLTEAQANIEISTVHGYGYKLEQQ